MSKAPKHSIYCMNCDWELKDTYKHTDGWKCPKCDGPVMTGERSVIHYLAGTAIRTFVHTKEGD